MKIVISNIEIPYELGVRMLKTRGGESPYEQLNDEWGAIEPLSFKDIAQIENLEHRRLAIGCLGTENLIKQVAPTLVDSQTITKKTNWINSNGVEESLNFDDTYELYRVERKILMGEKSHGGDFFYVKCKDATTNREYMIWVDAQSVVRANGSWDIDTIDSIKAIAWTITTNIKEGGIEKIIRQGDCVMIKPKSEFEIDSERHLSADEYRKLIVAES